MLHPETPCNRSYYDTCHMSYSRCYGCAMPRGKAYLNGNSFSVCIQNGISYHELIYNGGIIRCYGDIHLTLERYEMHSS